MTFLTSVLQVICKVATLKGGAQPGYLSVHPPSLSRELPVLRMVVARD